MISTKGFRDEENERAGEVLTGLLEEDFVPDLWRKEQRDKVEKELSEILDLSLSELFVITPDVLLLNLQKRNFNPAQYEQLGDLVLNIGDMEPEQQKKLAHHSLALYEYSQTDSKTFSFGLIQKINDAKDLSK